MELNSILHGNQALLSIRLEVEWVAPREVELAGLLVEALAARFEPGKYKDTYRENLRALLDAKIRGCSTSGRTDR